MKRVMHFTSVVGREGKFDPSPSRNITIFNMKKEAKAPRRLDVERGAQAISRRAQCSVDLGGFNARSPSPPPDDRRRRRMANAEDEDGEPQPPPELLDERNFLTSEDQAHAIALWHRRRQEEDEADPKGRKRRERRRALRKHDTQAGAMDAFRNCAVSGVRSPPAIGFPKARRFSDGSRPVASTPQPARSTAAAQEAGTLDGGSDDEDKAKEATAAKGATPTSVTPPPMRSVLRDARRSVRREQRPVDECQWSRVAARDGSSPLRRREQRRQARSRRVSMAAVSPDTIECPPAPPGPSGSPLSFTGATQGASPDRSPSLPQVSRAASGLHWSPSTVGGSFHRNASRPKMTTRDIAKTMERHEAGVRGTAGDPASKVGARGPLFRLDPGRPRIQGVDQPGVDAVAAEADAAMSKAKPSTLDATAAFHALKDRHAPRTFIATSGREHPAAVARSSTLQHTLDLLSPDNLRRRLDAQAAQLQQDAERVREIRERKAQERAVAKRKGEVVLTDAAAEEVTQRARQQEREALLGAFFYRSLDPRADDARCHEAPNVWRTGVSTQLQRDFFLCSVRDAADPTTVNARLPHIERLAPPPDAAVPGAPTPARRGRSRSDSVHPGEAADDAPAPSAALPALAQYLGIGREQFNDGTAATAPSATAAATPGASSPRLQLPDPVSPSRTAEASPSMSPVAAPLNPR